MNALRFVHQQVFQLKWQVLASLGLIMVLPLEEAVVILYEGDGFASSGLTMVTIWLTPLLAALIACASVQADMDERREAFWRSKPVSSHWFVSGKFIVGLILSLMIFICPLLFAWIITTLFGEDILNKNHFLILSVLFITLLTYSVCFFCNVLMRTTARAWLIGLTIACFALLIPFILPLDVKDVYADLFIGSGLLEAYMVVILGLTVLAFLGSLLAVPHNWRIHTHLRGLLWGGAGLIFVAFLLFSHQIANIKVLDEQPLSENLMFHSMSKRDNKIILSALKGNYQDEVYEVITHNDTIQLETIPGPSQATLDAIEKARSSTPQFEYPKDLERADYPYGTTPTVTYQIDSQVYHCSLSSYYRTGEVTKENGRVEKRNLYEKVYLRTYRDVAEHAIPLASLDLSDFLHNQENPLLAMRLIKNKAVALISDHCLVLDLSVPGSPTIIEDKPLPRSLRFFGARRVDAGVFKLLPVKSIDTQDRIKLSIDLASAPYSDERWQGLYSRWHADILNQTDPITYVLVTDKSVNRYEVTDWDDQNVTCRLMDKRPFTILETLFGNIYWDDRYFVKDNNLYLYNGSMLMVFDVTGPRIRKLGQFERISHRVGGIETMEVLDNGDILLLSAYQKWQGKDYTRTAVLQLLKNPQ